MHLLLGSLDDTICVGVRNALEAHNCPTRLIANPLAEPSRFVWQFDDQHSASHLIWDDEPPVRDNGIAGVFVRSLGWIDPSGWQTDDLNYVQSETQAALLAWLWSLRCPVVNRYSSALWYGPRFSLLSWRSLLRKHGLPMVETLVTNVETEARDFGRRLALEGEAGVVYGPLTSDVRYLITDVRDWTGLAAMQECAPVALARPHGPTQSVCVVGDHIVWGGEPSPSAVALEPALRRFAAAVGLTFVELAVAPTATELCVISVEPHPNLQHFGDAARERIVQGIANLLTTDAA